MDIDRAASFLAGHGRQLDRRRFAVVAGDPSPDDRRAVLTALAAYRNDDGGYGWGLEPDLRAPESQPVTALHAFEAIADAAPLADPNVPPLLDWLESVTLADGGLPFALPIADATACAPFWADADPTTSSLQITAGVAAQAHRVARSDDRVREHPWFDRVTQYCLDAIAAIDEAPFAYVLSFALQFLDAAADTRPEARELLEQLRAFVPADGAIPVAGGSEGETLRLLDFAGEPGRPVRGLVDDTAVARDLDRLTNEQQDDGGWTVDYSSFSPAAALEWRGYATVSAVATLRANGR